MGATTVRRRGKRISASKAEYLYERNRVAEGMLTSQLGPAEARDLFQHSKQTCQKWLHAYCQENNPDLFTELLIITQDKKGLERTSSPNIDLIFKHWTDFYKPVGDPCETLQLTPIDEIESQLIAQEDELKEVTDRAKQEILIRKRKLVDLRVARSRLMATQT